MAPSRSTILTGLFLATAGVGIVWASGGQFRTIIPPGIVVLPLIAAVVAVARWRWTPALAVVIATYVAIGMLANDGLADLAGDQGVGVAIGRWVQLIGLLIAAVAGVRALGVEASGRTAGRPVWGRMAQVLGLLLLAPMCAEYLAAYDDSTGDPVRLLTGLVVLAPLYGGAALLIREVARHARLGWFGMLLMAAAFGVLQAGVIDQSLFSADYRGMDSWRQYRDPTLIATIGVSAHQALTFISGHVIYSICAPIALVEAMGSSRRCEPWLGRPGLAVTILLYTAASALILTDHYSTESSHASAAQVVGSLVVVAALIAIAFFMSGRRGAAVDREIPRPRTIFLATMMVAGSLAIAPETWLGAVFAAAVFLAGAIALAHVSRASAWGAQHAVAVAAAFVLSSALLAFTYVPLIGEVSALRKYAHNAFFLTVLAALSIVAALRAGPKNVRATTDPS